MSHVCENVKCICLQHWNATERNVSIAVILFAQNQGECFVKFMQIEDLLKPEI